VSGPNSGPVEGKLTDRRKRTADQPLAIDLRVERTPDIDASSQIQANALKKKDRTTILQLLIIIIIIHRRGYRQ
jgi:hypothetical protein